MASGLPGYVDTVIIGGGPSSLILSYLLHGHIPYYRKPHHDSLLHAKLQREPNLLKVKPEAYSHFHSSLRYSTQALPLNTLLDTLIRPNADTEINPESCVAWVLEPEHAVSHVVLSGAERPGGQWVENPISASWNIGTLSYSEMLSLPGYTYAEHSNRRNQSPMPDLQRPSRSEVADYFSAYPDAVGISDALYTSTFVENVGRTATGFLIGSHNITCKHLVLASGIFSFNIAPPRLLQPVGALDNSDEPLLVIGSGFSAADAIISTPPHRKILHFFRWSPGDKSSPLRSCHQQAYPEYAGVYRQMKLAAVKSKKSANVSSPFMKKKGNPFFSRRDWAAVYEGFPNAEIIEVRIDSGTAKLCIRLESGEIVDRRAGRIAYVVGRRGQLEYLDAALRGEVLSIAGQEPGRDFISGRTLRSKAEANFEVAADVFIIGSLTGDSLIRYSFGSCVYAASSIMGITNGLRTGRKCGNGQMETIQKGENGVSGIMHSNGISHDDPHIDRRSAF